MISLKMIIPIKAEKFKSSLTLNIFIYLTTILILLVYSNITFASNHYVDNKSSGSNDGTSWSNAWEDFNSINWNYIMPGDTIFISGGADSSVYTSQLHIVVSGDSMKPIVLTASTDINHSGKVIIDVDQILGNCIYISGHQNLVIRNLYLRNSSDAVIIIKRSQNILIENCNIHMTSASGIDISYSQLINISRCKISTESYINHQTDGIYSQFNSNNVYQNNHIVISNTETGGHDDCIQSYDDESVTISGNYIEQRNAKQSNAQGIYITAPAGSGTTRIFNNIFNATQSSSNGITFRGDSGDPNARVQIVGNTVYGVNLSSQYYITGTTDPLIKNNIGYSVNGNEVLRLRDNTITNSNLIDNNIWKSKDNNPVGVNSSGVTWSHWQSMGYDIHSYISNPQFNDIANNDFTLKATSVGIDNGQTLFPPYNIDIDGRTRPIGLKWDIGAFESDSTESTTSNEIQLIGFDLYQNFPNPFNSVTVIKYKLYNDENVKIIIYNSIGEAVKILVDDLVQAGTYSLKVSSDNLSSGVYYYSLITSRSSETKKMIILK